MNNLPKIPDAADLIARIARYGFEDRLGHKLEMSVDYIRLAAIALGRREQTMIPPRDMRPIKRMINTTIYVGGK